MKPDFYKDHTVLLVVSVDAKGRLWVNQNAVMDAKNKDGGAVREVVKNALNQWQKRSK